MRRFYRRVIHISATDSPNVQLALRERRFGLRPSGKEVIPGVVSWDQYVKWSSEWDNVKKTIALEGKFYEGAENLLFPSEWLDQAAERAVNLKGRPRRAKAVGIDPGEGGADTVLTAVDELGLLPPEQEGLLALKTPDTSVIPGRVIAFGRKHNVPPEDWVFDRGGGGKQHADLLRRGVFPVRTVSFGEAAGPGLDTPRHLFPDEAHDLKEERSVYKNRRAEMYWTLRLLLDPGRAEEGPRFALPAEYTELRRQLAPVPLVWDPEGRVELPPKQRRGPRDTRKTLTEILGCSPDHADSLVLAVWGMKNPDAGPVAGVF
jgi:hypothetical protein